MSVRLEKEDTSGGVLFEGQFVLEQLKSGLNKIKIIARGKTKDAKAFGNVTHKTENSTWKYAEGCLKTTLKQPLILPCIEDLQKNTVKIPIWKPALEFFPDVHPQKEDLVGPSPGKEQKNEKQSQCNPTHPINRATMNQKFGVSLPDVQRRTQVVKHHRVVNDTEKRLQASEPKGCHSLALAYEDMGTGTKLSCLSIQAAALHPKDDLKFSMTGQTGSKGRCHKQLKLEKDSGSTSEKAERECTQRRTPKVPPPSRISCFDDKGLMGDSGALLPKSAEKLPVQVAVSISKFPFTVIKGQINPKAPDFCHFKLSFSVCWGSVLDALDDLEKLLRDFAVPLAKVSGERLMELSHRWNSCWRKTPLVNDLLSVLENWEEVSGLVLRPGQRYKGEGGIEAAAIHIQSCWRRYLARTAYLHHWQQKWMEGTSAISWLMCIQRRRARKALQARRFRQLENYRRRFQHLAANWKHIQSSKRTIIHIPSLGYSKSQRQKLRGFNVLQNRQIGRLCEIRDENVEVIYVCPVHPGEDISHYYTGLLKCDGADTGSAQALSSRRFTILTPEAVDYFPSHNMCLSTLLKYSPRTLKCIRTLIQGKQAYIVGGVAHVDDLAVADELGVPILAPEPAIAQLYSTKSVMRRIFSAAMVDVPPSHGDIYSLNQLHVVLAELMTKNIDVQRWLFKMNSEHGGRGTAYCDSCNLACYDWALQEYQRHGPELWKTESIQESVLLRYLDEIPQWLARYARPAKTSCYPTWACFLETFLGQGGVVEAFPPSDGVTCLTVDLLLEPGGEVTMLSCGDQLHAGCQLETVGSTVPQASVNPQTLHSICSSVGLACLKRLIVGHVSVDLATFVDHKTMEQKVWAIDLDVTYSDQLAMTQMLLLTTGGTLNCRTGCLEVPMPITGKRCEDQPPVVPRYAVIGTHLFHSNLMMFYWRGFLLMCKAYGIGFNIEKKQGTVFALYDSRQFNTSIGMIAVSEDLQGALVTFARNLSVIHEEVTPSKMEGENNFQMLIKDTEDVLQTVQKKMPVKDKPAP